MSRIQKATGFIIKSIDFKESDKILTIFSREFGKFSAIAKGARKLESKFGAALDLLTLNELVFYDKEGLKLLKEAHIINSFLPLKKDYDRLDVALHCARLLNLFIKEGQIERRIFRLFEALLKNLQHTEELKLYELAFKLKFIKALGFAPQLSHCSVCSLRSKDYGFSLEKGGLVCLDCKSIKDAPIDLSLARSLKAALELHLNKLNRLKLEEEALNCADQLLDGFIGYHLHPMTKGLRDSRRAGSVK